MRAILTYHSIDSSHSVISTSVETFRRHVRWLTSGRVRVVSIPEIMQLDDEIDAVSLTFDDGFANFAEAAAERLEDSGLPATVFVVTDYVGGANSWELESGARVPLLPLLDWPRLSRLHERGFTIASHSRGHLRLPALSSSALKNEVAGSAERIARELGFRPSGFAYPYGLTSPEAVHHVSGSFSFACTAEFRLQRGADAAHLLPRLDMYYFRRAGWLEKFGSPVFRRYVSVRGRGRRLKDLVPRPGRQVDG